MLFWNAVWMVGELYELYTLQELFAKMEELNSGNTSTYSEKLLQSKLKEKYRDHIYFMNIPGRSNIVCFRDMASYILYEQKMKTGEMKESIITAAAKLIKAVLRVLTKWTKCIPHLINCLTLKIRKNGYLKASNCCWVVWCLLSWNRVLLSSSNSI